MHSPSKLEASLKNSIRKQNLRRLLHLVSCMSLSKQLLALYILLSKFYSPAACRRQSTTAISRTIGVHAPAVILALSLLSSFKLTQACCQSINLYENLTYTPHVVHGYCVKLHCQEYMERRTTENKKNCNGTH